jgi:hypothetical protein
MALAQNGWLLWSYMTEVVAQEIYTQLQGFVSDPELREEIDRFFLEEKAHAETIRQDLPWLRGALELGLDSIGHLAGALWGFGTAISGSRQASNHILNLETSGIDYYSQLARTYPEGDPRRRRYEELRAEEEEHEDWFQTKAMQDWRDEPGPPGEVIEVTTVIPATVEEVFAFYTDTRSLGVIMPPLLPAMPMDPVSRYGLGSRFRLAVGVGPFRQVLDTEIPEFDPPFHYLDKKRHWALDTYEDHHHFEPMGTDLCRLTERFTIKLKGIDWPDNLPPSPLKLSVLLLLLYRHMATYRYFSLQATSKPAGKVWVSWVTSEAAALSHDRPR